MLTLLLTLLACAPPTCDEVEGAICEDDLAAWMDDTASPGGWAWFDAEGVQVTVDAELLWKDDDGVIWQVDAVLAEPYALEVDSILTSPRYESEDCTGDALVVNPPPPNFAFAASGAAVLVWNGPTVLTPDRMLSWSSSGGCEEVNYQPGSAGLWSEVDELVGVVVVGWLAPLRLEAL